MVKRAKLTLEHPKVEKDKEAEGSESIAAEHPADSDRQDNLGKFLLVAGLAIVSLIVFRQKIF